MKLAVVRFLKGGCPPRCPPFSAVAIARRTFLRGVRLAVVRLLRMNLFLEHTQELQQHISSTQHRFFTRIVE